MFILIRLRFILHFVIFYNNHSGRVSQIYVELQKEMKQVFVEVKLTGDSCIMPFDEEAEILLIKTWVVLWNAQIWLPSTCCTTLSSITKSAQQKYWDCRSNLNVNVQVSGWHLNLLNNILAAMCTCINVDMQITARLFYCSLLILIKLRTEVFILLYLLTRSSICRMGLRLELHMLTDDRMNTMERSTRWLHFPHTSHMHIVLLH